jgi:replication-associated recombination protein RarA
MIIGHKKIVSDLKTLANGGALGHAYLFYGPAMVGKRTVAAALARFLEKGVFEPPAEGEVLQDTKIIDLAFAKQLEPEKKGDSIGIGAVREIKNFLWQKPNASPRRTLILDEAEFLTTEAQNALLKITEEPPASSLIILVSSDAEGLLTTILSRIEKIYFGLVPGEEISQWLTHERKLSVPEAKAAARRAFGKPGLALRFLEDGVLRENVVLAEELLKVQLAGRRDLMKEIMEPDDFNFQKFIDALILVLATEKESKTRNILWHRALALADREANFSLNPRLQLENLFVGE